MARMPDDQKERLKKEISIQRLAEARGIKLRRVGKELMGLCPFHDDRNPSLCIDPVKNVWDCKGACGEGGDVIRWVARAEGISDAHALELLKADYLPMAAGPIQLVKKSTVPKLPAPVTAEGDDQALMMRVVDFYWRTLKAEPEAMKYLAGRGITSSEAIDRFKLGYANRALGRRLPAKNRAPGAAIRGRLEELGIFRKSSGHEHFNGSLVIPIITPAGEVVEMYGRKITRMSALRDGTPAHLYLPGEHRGVWNEEALIASKEIILCEALIDALTFWSAGNRNVTASYGTNGFTADHKAAFEKHGTERVYIAYDNDEAGNKSAAKLAGELIEMGIECFRVEFPKNVDANEYARTTQPATKLFGVLLNRASWLGKGKRPEPRAMVPMTVAPSVVAAPKVVAAPEEKQAAKEKTIESAAPEPVIEERIIEEESILAEIEAQAASPLEAAPVASIEPEPAPASSPVEIPNHVLPLAAVVASPRPHEVEIEVRGEDLLMRISNREYRVRGLEKNMSDQMLRVNLRVLGVNKYGDVALHVDTLELNHARPRNAFCKQAADELNVKEETLRRELGVLMLKLENRRDEQIVKALEPKAPVDMMTEEEREAALKLLHDPHLKERILEGFTRCGVVGEETNKLLGYFAAVSRHLSEPLAVIVQSSSAAGKSSLMDAVLSFMPEEQRVQYSAMTGQSLFYMSELDLKHKILAIAEEEGMSGAAYPLKLLQSEHKLSIASTGKDPASGRHITHKYSVEGPVMIFMTTTKHEIDEELLNRCLVLTVNEDREQTQAIHRLQREAQTLAGMVRRKERDAVLALHRNAHRLLKPIQVVNERALALCFPDSMTRMRRDHMKFLTLIRAVTFLFQYQRPVQTGAIGEYIECTEADVELAQQLIDEVLGRSLDELPPQTRRLLLLIDDMVVAACEREKIERAEHRFSRRDVRAFTGWGDSQLKKHLARLEDMEYLIVHRGGRGQSFVYELFFDRHAESTRRVLPGMFSYDGEKSRPEEDKSRGGHGQVTGVSPGGHDAKSPVSTVVPYDIDFNIEENTYRGAKQNGHHVVLMAGVKG
jgi:DNA primase catalytic core